MNSGSKRRQCDDVVRHTVYKDSCKLKVKENLLNNGQLCDITFIST